MEWFILWIVLAAVAGSIAKSKHHSAPAYFICSIIFSPLIAIPLALLLKTNTKKLEAEQLRNGTAKRCPACAELVRTEATKCKHCGEVLTAPPG